MTPADKRISELLDRWLTSIELHLKYVQLDETSYRQIQPWPEHERPNRWILETAQEKVLQLKSLQRAHAANHDGSFAESLELMCFLANLVGAQNIKRFIPLADPNKEKAPTTSQPSTATTSDTSNDTQATRQMPQAVSKKPPAKMAAADDSETREMPRLKTVAKKTTPPPSVAKRAVTKVANQSKPTPAASQTTDQGQQVVIADAVRLLKWGREWHELVELIARMAERPSAGEIRRILRTYKHIIEAQVRR